MLVYLWKVTSSAGLNLKKMNSETAKNKNFWT